jgi:GNAT superfamily N-acetyltransferase
MRVVSVKGGEAGDDVLVAITVRVGSVDDHRAVASLRYRMDAEVDSPSGSPADFAAVFDHWLDRHGDAWDFFVAEDDGHVIGMLWLAKVPRMPRPSNPSPAPIGYVTAFFVEERYRNAGVGGALLAAMNSVADELPYETLVVWPSERGASAYHRADFHSSEELLERPILHS